MNPHSGDFRGWYTSRKLPHFDAAETILFITFRLADSLPSHILREMRKEVDRLPEGLRSDALRVQMEKYLDQGYGSCVLFHPEMAATLQSAFQHHAGRRYELLSWVIMPNHVHILIRPSWSLPRIVQGWKSWSARWALLNAARLELALPVGGFWMRGYWDRYIRNEDHLASALDYIHQNPVKAGLCASAGQWPWSSACRENAVTRAARLRDPNSAT